MKRKTYEEIWREFSAKHGDTPETKRIHDKWKWIASQV